MPEQNSKFFFPRDWFIDSVGRDFGDKQWENFVKSMDDFTDKYIRQLESLPYE
jgi:hypothetical protein